jgi:hypothetical protein
VNGTGSSTDVSSRCTLCPGGCELHLAAAGADAWHAEYPLRRAQGVCPRGSSLPELMTHPRRIVSAARRGDDGRVALSLQRALDEVIDAAGAGRITLCLDGNLPCDQLLQAAAWCRQWGQADLCLVVEPADEQLLLGVEASSAAYLSPADLAGCDGFVIVGDAFAADPACSHGVFERRSAQSKTPIVSIDPAGGTGAKFATHRVRTPAGGEHAALAQVAAAAGLEAAGAPSGAALPSAQAAGRAIADCERLGVLVAAEYGRGAPWRRIGLLAGRLAQARGGGVAPQTVGANALASVRLTCAARGLQLLRLSEALTGRDGSLVVIGCDLLGRLGWRGVEGMDLIAAAAALPNRTTAAARLLLPVAMSGEQGGAFLLDGDRPVTVAPLLAPPAGVPSAAELVAELARRAGAVAPPPVEMDWGRRCRADAPPASAAVGWQDPAGPLAVLARGAAHAGCGALTALASWQRQVEDLPEVRLSAELADELAVKNLAAVTVSAGDGAAERVRARVRVAPELSGRTLVLPEGVAAVRALGPCRVQVDAAAVVSEPIAVKVDT